MLVAVPVGVDLGIAQAVVALRSITRTFLLRRAGTTARLAVCGNARKANDARSAT